MEEPEKTVEEKGKFWLDRLHVRIITMEVMIERAEAAGGNRVKIQENKEFLRDLEELAKVFSLTRMENQILKKKV